jgi:rod shape-determining protein MreD
MKNALLLILAFYFLVLLQTSFLVHFNIYGTIPNFVIIFVILLNFFEKPEKKLGIVLGFLAGLFLDIFSSSFFGFYTLILSAISFFIKYVLKSYLRLWT